MRIAIDAPPVRALSANEKRVYELLQKGKTPREIAKKLHLAMGSTDDLKYNAHDVMPDTIINLITNIRSKGWDIPTDNKEDNAMAKAKLTEEQKRSIVTESQAGAKVGELAAKYNIGKSSIYNVLADYKEHGERAFVTDEEKEPATAATETGSEQEICVDIPADIIPETEENVKPESENAEPLIPQSVIEACWGRIDDLRQQIAAEQAVIDDWERQIAEIKEFLELARIANPMGGAV